MFTPEIMEAIPTALEQIFDSLQMSIMADIVRKLVLAQELTPTSVYKIGRLYKLGKSKSAIKSIVQNTLDLSNSEIKNIFSGVIESGYNEAESAFIEQGKEFIPYAENEPLQQFVRAVQAQTQGECKNITQSMGFAKRQPDGSLGFTPAADYYQETLDKAVTEIASGASDYNTVLEKTVTEMINSGLRTVDYASGHSNRVTVAARRAVATGLNQVVGKINEENAEKLGTNYFEVSWHSGARPTHQVWQGRVYSKEELESVCGLGTVTGLCGANCYHSYSPFTPGITPRTYTDEQLDQMNAEENKPVEYNGKTYTKYEATQRQRRLETTMRAQRQKIKLLEEGGADEQALINARARYVKTSDEYVNFSKSMGLSQQWDRVTVGGNSLEGITKPKKANSPISGIKTTSLPVKNTENHTFKGKFGVEKSDGSGIMKEKSRDYSSVGTNNFSDSNKQILLQDERVLSGNNYETANIYDSNGNMKFSKKGTAEGVNFSDEEIKSMNGCILTHNHPNGTVFSPEDINILRRGKLSEIRACNEKGSYVLRNTGDWHKDLPNLKTIKDAYWNCMNTAGERYVDIAAQEGKPIFAYFGEMEEDGLRLFSEKYGLEFSWEGIKDES